MAADPALQVRQRALRDRAFFRKRFLAAAKTQAAFILDGVRKRRKQAEVDVHGLVRASLRRLRAGSAPDVAAADVCNQSAVRRPRRGWREESTEPFGRGGAAGSRCT